MITEKYRQYFDSCFSDLNTHPNGIIDQSAIYCCAQWICHYSAYKELNIEDVSKLLETEAMQQIVKILFDNREVEFDISSVYRLCQLIRRTNFFDSRAKLFYQYYLPGIISDTSLFSDKDLPSFNNGPVSCTMIHLALIYAGAKLGTKEIFYCLVTDVYSLHQKDIEYFHVDYDEFERYWVAVHWLDTIHSVPKRQIIESAVKVYQKYHVPVSVLLEQYAQANHFQSGELNRVSNPWEYVNKSFKRNIPERGMSIDEKLFNDAAYQISRQLPTDVIQTIFYKGRDDSRIECALIRSEVKRLNTTKKRCLLVNPTGSSNKL